MIKKYGVTGMSCAACSARVEKAVSSVQGVKSCSVNLLTASMIVDADVPEETVIKAVVDAGYGVVTENKTTESKTEDGEVKGMLRRLIWSAGFVLVLMYFSMGHMMWNWPVPEFFDGNCSASGLGQLLLAAAVMVINQKFFVNGFRGLLHRAPNMDTLVALGSSASFIYSTYALFQITAAQQNGDAELSMHYMHEMYFESAAMILTFITVGKMLEAYSKGRTTDAVRSLIALAPETACIIKDGKEVTVPASEIQKGDIFVLRPGDRIPADGIVLEGTSSVDESALTGESIPSDKSAGDNVSAATINASGFLKCEAVRVGEDTSLSQIIRMVSDAAATKAPAARIADKVSGIFVPAVTAIAAVTVIAWLIAGQDIGFALERGISVLVISCPCALGLATPVAVMVGNGVGARNGILFKTAETLENTGKIKIAAIDKTGTVTKGEPEVTDIIPYESITSEKLMQLAYLAEKQSSHPLAAAVVKMAEEKGTECFEVSDFSVLPGNGVRADHDGKTIFGGNLSYIGSVTEIPDDYKKKVQELAAEGKTPLLFAYGKDFLGIIAAADAVREDSPAAVAMLRNMGIRVVLLTGDNRVTAEAINKKIGADDVISDVLPDGKESVIRKLKQSGMTAMIGDGINDAPALTAADIGIAIGAGTDVAVDAADAVLVNSRLSDAAAAIRLSRQVLKNIKENLFWAFIYNIIGIPVAAGVFIPLFGLKLSPMFGAAAMSLSSFFVVTNALRLNLFKLHDTKHDNMIKNIIDINTEEVKSMKKTMHIEGMMCPHCEGRVKQTLEAMEGVVSADVSHQTGTAAVEMSSGISDDALRSAVEAQGYKVTGIE